MPNLGIVMQHFQDSLQKNMPGQYTLGLPPTHDSSHHQDYYIFSSESL